MAQSRTMRFKVSLVDFANVTAPLGCDQKFIHSLFFSNTKPDKTPPSDLSAFIATVNQYFYFISDGLLGIHEIKESEYLQ